MEQSERDEHGEAGVHRRLRQQIARDARARLVHRPRRDGETAEADETQQSVAQLFAGQQHERHQHHDEAGARERLQPRRERARHVRHMRRAVLLHDDRGGLLGGRLGIGRRLPLDLALGLGGRARHRLLRALQAGAAAEQADVGDLLADVVAIARQLLAEAHDLDHQHGADAAHDGQRQEHDDDHAEHARHMPALQ